MSSESPRQEADSSTDATDKEFSCDYCEKSYTNQPSLNSHVGLSHPEKTGVTVECDYCGDDITRTQGVLDSSKNNFCSRDCKYSYRSESDEYSGENHYRYNQVETCCEYCGSKLVRDGSRVERYDNQFCDSDCYGSYVSEEGLNEGENNPVYNSKTKKCVQCGDEFTAPVSVLENGRKCCGEECAYEYISEEYSGEDNWNYTGYYLESYGDNWDEIRQEVRERDNFNCQACAKSENDLERELDVHHIVPLSEFEKPEEANELSNLVSLCGSCHSKWEGLYLRPDTL